MKRTLLTGVAIVVLAGCSPEKANEAVQFASLETARVLGREMVHSIAAGDHVFVARGASFLEGYCERVGPETRSLARSVLSVDGRPAVAIDCDVVRQLAAKSAS